MDNHHILFSGQPENTISIYHPNNVIYTSIFIYIYLCIYLSTYLYIYIYMYRYYLSVDLSTDISIDLSICIYLYLYIYIFLLYNYIFAGLGRLQWHYKCHWKGVNNTGTKTNQWTESKWMPHHCEQNHIFQQHRCQKNMA